MWTYNTNLQAEKDQVRFLVHDTDTSRQLFQDEEIKWVLTQEANVYTTAAMLCENLVAKNGGVKSKKISELSITYDPVFYMTMAANLRARGAGHQVPYAGGISVSDKLAVQADTDATTSAIVRGLEDNPAAPPVATPPINPTSSY